MCQLFTAHTKEHSTASQRNGHKDALATPIQHLLMALYSGSLLISFCQRKVKRRSVRHLDILERLGTWS